MTTLQQFNSEMLIKTGPYKFTYITEYKTVCIFGFSVQFCIRIYIESALYGFINRFTYINESSNQLLLHNFVFLRCVLL